MRNILFVIVAFFLTESILAQYDKELFEKEFQKEMSESKYSQRESHSAAYQRVPPQPVPAWFVNPPVSDSNAVYAIGISDPEMDTTAALNQAIYRAQIIANVLRKSTTQLLCDFYLNEVDNSSDIVYEHFTQINSVLPLKANFEVVESFRNRFDETLVLIKYFPIINLSPDEGNIIKLELYRAEVETSVKGKFESIYELAVKSNTASEPDPMVYQLTDLGNRFDVETTENNTNKIVPIYTLGYTGIPSTDSVQNCYFSHGLWKEYFRSVMSYIIVKAREKPENIKHISDTYQKNTLEKLTRGISVNKMRFVLTGVSFADSKLNVTMQELPLNE